MLDPCYSANVPPGTSVRILCDGSEVTGKVKAVLSPLNYNPLGIRVVLDGNDALVGRVIEILSNSMHTNDKILAMLSCTESQTLEFKASLLTPENTVEKIMKKFNITNQQDAKKKLQKDSKKIIYSSMKTIAGFANADGGDLLIGVEDRTNFVIGLDNDFQRVNGNDGDGFLIELKNQIKSHFFDFGIFSNISKMDVIEIKGKEICHVHVLPSTTAHVITEKITSTSIEKFYVRVFNSTEEFSPRDFYEKHWPKHVKKYLSSI